jgi:hypothetical protein
LRFDSETRAKIKLTKDERRAVFGGTLKVLRRPQKPEGEPEPIVVSWTRGGRQVADRSTGATIEVERQPRLWITLKGWHLRQGSTEWETAVTIHDEREQHRVLSNGLGGIPREAGLRTRWGERVIHSDGEVKVVPKRVPTKEEQYENWTSETERGYGGRNEFEVDAEGELQPALGVSDDELARFLRPIDQGGHGVEDANLAARMKRRKQERVMRLEMRLADVRKLKMTRAEKAIEEELGELRAPA